MGFREGCVFFGFCVLVIVSLVRMHNHGNESITTNTVSLRSWASWLPRSTKVVKQDNGTWKNWAESVGGVVLGEGASLRGPPTRTEGGGGISRQNIALSYLLTCLRGLWGCRHKEMPPSRRLGENATQQKLTAKGCTPPEKYSPLQETSVLLTVFDLVTIIYGDVLFCWMISVAFFFLFFSIS